MDNGGVVEGTVEHMHCSLEESGPIFFGRVDEVIAWFSVVGMLL